MTDAHGASCAVWPRPLGRSPPEKPRLRENGETISGAVDRRPVRANDGKPGGSHRPLPGSTSCPKRRSSDRWCGRTLGDGRDGCGAGNRATRSHCVPGLIPGSVLPSFNTDGHDRGNRPGHPDSLRGPVLILTICSWRTIRSGAGNHSESDLKTIAQYSNLVAAELEEFDQGYNDGFRGESADPDAGKKYWAGYDKGRWDGGLFGSRSGRNETFG